MSIEKHPAWDKANRGDTEALTIVSADAIELGIDLDKCRDLLLRYGQNLNPASWFNLGLIYLKLGILDRAEHYLAKAADSGHIQFMVPYARMLKEGRFGEANRNKAIAYLKEAASRGSIHAQILLLKENRHSRGIWFLPVYVCKKMILSIRNAKLYSQNPNDIRIYKYSEFDKNIDQTWPNWREEI